MSITNQFLASLPPPQYQNIPDYETVYAQLKAVWFQLDPAYPYLDDDDGAALILQAWAYERRMLMLLMSETAKKTLLFFASGGELDHLAAEHSVVRLLITPAVGDTPAVYESDARLLERLLYRIDSPPTAGTVASYKYHVLTSSPLVKSVTVFSPNHPNGYNMGGQVIINILSTEGDHIPTTELLETVRDYILQEDVKGLNDIVLVEGAIPKVVDVHVKVKLLKGTPLAVFQAIEGKFVTAFEKAQDMGMDFTRSFITSVTHVSGVHSVNVLLPEANVGILPNEYPILGTVSIEFDGYSDGEGYNVEANEVARAMRTIYQMYENQCIASSRTALQIAEDLTESSRPGILEPTVIGFAQYLGLTTGITKPDGTYRTEAEICVLIHNKLKVKYA